MHGTWVCTGNSFVFVNTKSIITNFQNGNIRLHTPVWLHWAGKIENENTSATPFELRVHGVGSQRYIYENLISSVQYHALVPGVIFAKWIQWSVHQNRALPEFAHGVSVGRNQWHKIITSILLGAGIIIAGSANFKQTWQSRRKRCLLMVSGFSG